MTDTPSSGRDAQAASPSQLVQIGLKWKLSRRFETENLTRSIHVRDDESLLVEIFHMAPDFIISFMFERLHSAPCSIISGLLYYTRQS
mmetsp:Transcript_18383/g.38459  ORF Transcript_18383/g.38459 Transcript_18383/m.38459 type:complete len:88 (+) Transcript_18383:35-298(+)